MNLSEVFKALSDGTRLSIFELIRSRCQHGCRLPEKALGQSVSEIADHLQVTLPTVSHHLKELRKAGLIRCKKRGRWVYCTPNDDVLRDIERFARGSVRSETALGQPRPDGDHP